MTDEWRAYPAAFIAAGIHGSKHQTIKHLDKIYVRGDVHTNTVESAFSLLKRGVVGSFHYISIKHLPRYLSEFEYRFNRRDRKGEPKRDMFTETLQRMAKAEPMSFDTLIGKESCSEPF
jgi:hypothetical protein